MNDVQCKRPNVSVTKMEESIHYLFICLFAVVRPWSVYVEQAKVCGSSR